jgi:PucR family transcriptional regulator, purine catabolism regulatory protein
MLTVEGLAGELDLKLAAGSAAADRPIRWVHITEIEDPTPWLNGGELLLTTGIQLKTAASQRAFVRLLAGHGIAGIGLGTGFDHKRIPKAMVAEAKRQELPLFAVPYEMPFIAITEKAFTRLVNEQYDVLERATALHERLERLVIEEQGLTQILGTVAAAIGGAALVVDGGGRTISRSRGDAEPTRAMLTKLRREIAARGPERRASPFIPEHPELADRALALPVPTGGQGLLRAWLAVVRESAPLGDFERLCARQAAIVVALELMRERTVRETERRLAGDVLAEALTGGLEPEELRGRMRPFGIGERAAVLMFELEDPAAAEGTLEAALAQTGTTGLVAAARTPRDPLLCAVVDTGDGDPIELARKAKAFLAAEHGPVRAAASRTAPVESLRRGFHEARCALEATSFADGDAPEVASHRDLGAFTLLLALQDDEALRSYSESLLAPIEADGQYGSELLRSLEAYIEQNGQWERAARELYCHRHTLRYRIRRVEDLTGRDLSRAHDRIELWLALRAKELIR